jgi:hypothetical protein
LKFDAKRVGIGFFSRLKIVDGNAYKLLGIGRSSGKFCPLFQHFMKAKAVVENPTLRVGDLLTAYKLESFGYLICILFTRAAPDAGLC